MAPAASLFVVVDGTRAFGGPESDRCSNGLRESARARPRSAKAAAGVRVKSSTNIGPRFGQSRPEFDQLWAPCGAGTTMALERFLRRVALRGAAPLARRRPGFGSPFPHSARRRLAAAFEEDDDAGRRSAAPVSGGGETGGADVDLGHRAPLNIS